MIFAYDDWNREHVGKHGVGADDAEHAVRNARPPYPQKIEHGKFLIHGRDRAGRLIEVVFAFRIAGEVAYDAVDFLDLDELSDAENAVAVYIIHAMPLTEQGKKRFRRRLK